MPKKKHTPELIVEGSQGSGESRLSFARVTGSKGGFYGFTGFCLDRLITHWNVEGLTLYHRCQVGRNPYADIEDASLRIFPGGSHLENHVYRPCVQVRRSQVLV